MDTSMNTTTEQQANTSTSATHMQSHEKPLHGIKLTCRVTGKSRMSSMKYLTEKACKHGATMHDVVKWYCCKQGMDIVSKDLNYPDRNALICFNGKRQKKQ